MNFIIEDFITEIECHYQLGGEFAVSSETRKDIENKLFNNELYIIENDAYNIFYNRFYNNVLLDLLSREPYTGMFLKEEIEFYSWFKELLNMQSPIKFRDNHIDELFFKFCKDYFLIESTEDSTELMGYCDNSLSWLKDWLDNWRMYNTRNYPLLFKRISYYYILKYNMQDIDFLTKIGIREEGAKLVTKKKDEQTGKYTEYTQNKSKNLLNKWNIYSSYKKKTLSLNNVALPIKRRGKKQEYLLSFIQEVYYEANRINKNIGSNSISTVTSYKETRPKTDNLSAFLDVFAGTATVAASMNIKSEGKIINEFDPFVLDTLFVLIHYPKEFQNRFADFNKKIIDGDYEKEIRKIYKFDGVPNKIGDKKNPQAILNNENGRNGLWYYSRDNVYSFIESKYRKNWSGDTEDLVIKLRNAWFYCEAILVGWKEGFEAINYGVLSDLKKSFEHDYLDYSIMDNDSIEEIEKELDKMLNIACIFIYYHSYSSSNPSGEPNFRSVNVKSYIKLLSNYFNISDIESEETNTITINLVNLKKLRLLRSYLSDWRKCLKKAVIGQKSFEELFISSDKYRDYFTDEYEQNKDSDSEEKYNEYDLATLNLRDSVFYYLDSPYYLTSDYNISFTDEMHIEMLEKLRTCEANWLFSMQYFKGEKTYSRGKKPSIYIKDYLNYYKGFISPLVNTETVNGKMYYSNLIIKNKYDGLLNNFIENKPMPVIKNFNTDKNYKQVYAILFREGVDSKSGKSKFSKDDEDEFYEMLELYDDEAIENKKEKEGYEIFITNVDCSRILPYSSDLVQLPLEELIRCAEKNLPFEDVRNYALALRRFELNNILI